jgi:DNA-binding transcriptional regulator YhcF (GntR family)
MSERDTKREEELRKKREYQKVYDAKHKEEILRKRRESYSTLSEEEKRIRNRKKYDRKMGKPVVTKGLLKDAVAKGLTDSEIAELVRRM